MEPAVRCNAAPGMPALRLGHVMSGVRWCRYRGFASAINNYLPASMTWPDRQRWSQALREGQWQLFQVGTFLSLC